MHGDPVWLASLSRRNHLTDRFVPVPCWSTAEMEDAKNRLMAVLDGVGDPERQRLFRMNVTLCLHRAVSAAEARRLPQRFWDAQAVGLAGGPVEILWETEPGSPSTRPCERPSKVPLPGYLAEPLLWRPQDCLTCGPCRDRLRVEAETAALYRYVP